MQVNERDALIFLATFISTDGHIDKKGIISIFSQDKELIDKAKYLIDKAGLRYSEYVDKNEFRTLNITPISMAYVKLKDYKMFMLERKFERLEKRFGDKGIEKRIECYQEVMSLNRLGKESQGKKGKGLLPKMTELSNKYNIAITTLQAWYYNHQVPDVLRIGISKANAGK